ncbi:9507_t:CDS:2 [Ambispora gerdemannii]|uniref:9507_t:CDS:1 n=1 Tax=Ambispora gerdemannii TaxID=144530 RepID=A0A9N9BIQ2_9GLOM|nr:9507_t:CDS:2 [Ambispora gerdemannii]
MAWNASKRSSSSDVSTTTTASRRVKPRPISTDLTDEQHKEIRDAFDMFVPEGETEMDTKDLKVAMRALGFELKKEELKRILSDLDSPERGQIDYDTFVLIVDAKLSECDIKEEFKKIFAMFDDDETGKISFKNLKRVAQELNENIDDNELREMIEEADRNGDGEVDEEEFIHLMQKLNVY